MNFLKISVVPLLKKLGHKVALVLGPVVNLSPFAIAQAMVILVQILGGVVELLLTQELVNAHMNVCRLL